MLKELKKNKRERKRIVIINLIITIISCVAVLEFMDKIAD